ncbi:class I SAM-dependent methyltransferase [Amycolatopsis sp. NPDC049868]|uniref:class I SAM-dependent methyltransferase n=1 Tax=Amycolatopsis sp. NPDC049868 TaxID=3363934 RepID=UPI0037BD0084
MPEPHIDAISSHPWVERAWHTGADEVVIQPRAEALAVHPVLGPLVREHLEHWSEVYEWIYRTSDTAQPADLDLSGWRASDTGEPLPREHMVDWIDRTVELVREAKPRCVLELGCGSGLLLRHLHADVERYVGTDVSEVVVERLRAAALSGVRPVIAAAHELGSPQVVEALSGRRPDCVLLNSVTQCFPGGDYLDAVVGAALELVSDGGRVIVGDFRHAGLADRYYRWLEPDDEAAALRAAADEEFVFDPRLLARIAARATRPVSVSVRAKTMAADTELTRYRCDVVLHVSAEPAPRPAVVAWHTLTGDRLTAARALVEAGPVVVSGIPHALLEDDPEGVRPHVLRACLAGTGAIVGLDLDHPTRLQVCPPTGTPAGEILPPSDATTQEPLTRFVAHRLPEVVRDHLHRMLPGVTPPALTVAYGRNAR